MVIHKAQIHNVLPDDLASKAKIGYLRSNLLGNKCEANEQWMQMFGAAEGDNLDDVFKKSGVVHSVDVYSINSFMANALRGTERTYRGFLRLRPLQNNGNEWEWYHITIQVEKYDPEHGIIDTIAFYYGASEIMSVQSPEDLDRYSEYADAVQALNCIPWSLNLKTHTLTSNPSFIDRKYGFTSDHRVFSLDEHMSSILPEYQEEFMRTLNLIEAGLIERSKLEYQAYLGKSTEPVWVETSLLLRDKDSQGKPLTVIGALVVIQERKEAEFAIIEAKQKAQQMADMKSTFLSSMSHEFRTPLNSILGFSTLMAHSDSVEERMQCLGAVQAGGRQLLDIIDDVIKLCKLDSGEIFMRHERFDINDLCLQLVDEMRPLRREGVNASFFRTTPDLMVVGDKQYTGEVLRQLLANALEHTDQGSVVVTCRYIDADFIKVSVADTGGGMSPAVVEHAFERFFKGDSYRPGTGLGLPIVKRLVTMWGGHVSIDSHVGEGTTVSFTVPAHNVGSSAI